MHGGEQKQVKTIITVIKKYLKNLRIIPSFFRLVWTSLYLNFK
ncbi:hypothetical protein HMPREF9996_01080 [Aggregatibacter actinomycetemcomitans Y4]|nr:hypothetical protein HMPREF9996_01080 [Aggregatibacter actinomycetemcomitans Y4]